MISRKKVLDMIENGEGLNVEYKQRFSTHEKIAKEIKVLRNHGSRQAYHHNVIGYNSRLDALQAAILRVRLKHLDKWSEGRNRT